MLFQAVPCYSLQFQGIPCTFIRFLDAIPSYSLLFHAIPNYSSVLQTTSGDVVVPNDFMLFQAIPYYSIRFLAMLFQAIPCYSVLFQAIPSCSIPCDVIPSYSLIFLAGRCYSMRLLFYGIPCYPWKSCSTPSHTMSYDSMRSHTIPCHPTLPDSVKIATANDKMPLFEKSSLGDPLVMILELQRQSQRHCFVNTLLRNKNSPASNLVFLNNVRFEC